MMTNSVNSSRANGDTSTLNFTMGIRLLLLSFIFFAIQPAPVLIAIGAPQPVATNHPIIAVHTRLTDEVEEWKIQRSLELVREMGATTIVEFFPWAYYAGSDGGFAWDHPDLVVNHAHAQGLQIIARIGLTPGWARPPDTPLNYLDETAYEGFGLFAAAFAERYKGKVDFIIVGNEPNLNFEWGYRVAPPQDYVELLKVVYPMIKEANPDMGVLAGALAPTLEPEGSEWGTNELIYLQRLYEGGFEPYFDALAAHTYGLTFPAEADPSPELLNFRRIELLREVMVQNGDADKEIYITEAGWNDHPRWTLAVRPAQRIMNTIKMFEHAEANWPYVNAIAIWQFRTPAPTKSYHDNFTLVTPEFVKRPIYDAIKAFARE